MIRSLPWLAVLLPSVALADGLPESSQGLVPEMWSDSGSAQPADRSAPTEWWTALGGEELASLLGDTDTTIDAETANLRVVQAQARTLQTTAALLPAASIVGSTSLGPTAALFANQGNAIATDQLPSTYTSGNVAAQLSVPLSVWKTLPSQAAARADADGARATDDLTRANTAVQLGRLWVDVVYSRERLDVVRAQIEGDAALADLVDARYRVGASAGSDVLQQRQQLAASRASLPDAEAAVVRAERNLATFLRVPVTALELQTTTLPVVASGPVLPRPMHLVESSPTVRSAVADLEASQRRTTAAQTAFLPDLSASASAGYLYNDLNKDAWTETWSVGATLTVPVFNGGRNAGALQEARAGRNIADLAVQDAVLDVVNTTENALTTFAQRAAEVDANRDRAAAAAAAFEAAQADYAAGQTAYNAVLTASSTAQSAELSLLASRRTHLDAYLDLAAVSAGAWVGDLEER